MDNYKVDRGKEIAGALHEVLKANGQPDDKLGFLMLQVAHETGGFDSHVSHVNNMTGIKYNPKGRLVEGEYDSGIKSPEGNNYSGFSDVLAWAKRYYNILAQNKYKPLNATNITDFAARLKQGGYFTASLQEYEKALRSWLPTMKKYFSNITFAKASAFGIVLVVLIVSLYIINQ